MASHTTARDGPGLSTPEPTVTALPHSRKEDAPEPLSAEKSTASDESPLETDSPADAGPEFKEGGYGW